MGGFSYPGMDAGNTLSLDQAQSALDALANYLRREYAKGKIPLIIAGAGTSAVDLERAMSNGKKQRYEKGLPCLGEMIQEIQRLVEAARADGDAELDNLKLLFQSLERKSDQKLMDLVDREWIGKLFVVLADGESQAVRRIWDDFCNWFFFQCCGGESGALNIDTSKASLQIAKLYELLDALCLSANFDDFLEYALAGVKLSDRGISLFNKKHADQYFRRNRRGKKKFGDSPHNRCVLHANGDVLWLHCSGDKDEGYCPRRGKYIPAFYDRQHIDEDNVLLCQICGSTMRPTMTMPGTYQKDYNTRKIISSIWEHLASKISCVITVGLSCNWDDVLLKFILGLLLERDIPHLDINDFSDPTHEGDTAIVRHIVQEKRFHSCCIRADAAKGLEALVRAVRESPELPDCYSTIQADQGSGEMPAFFDELVGILENNDEIKRLSHVSQLGLKAMFGEASQENDRWEHSKEVARIAYRLYHQFCLNSKKGETLFEQALLCTAGLLHDCGHLPFSHLLEDVFEELSWGISEDGSSFKHGQYSKYLIYRLVQSEDGRLRAFFEQYGITAEEVVQLIEGNYGVGYLDTLINSAVDADKIAYIFTDAEQMQRALMLKRNDFISRLAEKAYITQEGFVALDSTSAWYAMRLLDERRRMYDELYLNPNIRCMEAAAKYIITTYFVQKYNRVAFDGAARDRIGKNQFDLGGYRIMLAIQDMASMCGGSYTGFEDLSLSVGARAKQSLKACMEIVQAISTGEPSLEEWNLLRQMYHQLTGAPWNDTPRSDVDRGGIGMLAPYQDDQIREMAERIQYKKLAEVRKRIILNYPGLILIDLHQPIRYYSVSPARQPRGRLDGTYCAQDTILLPDSERSQWRDEGSLASIPLSEYIKKYESQAERRPVFQVFKIGGDQSDCEHAVNMLKKELQKQLSVQRGNTE